MFTPLSRNRELFRHVSAYKMRDDRNLNLASDSDTTKLV